MTAAGIELLSVPYDSGRRGWRMGAGPQALLRAGLVQQLRGSVGDVELVPIESTAGEHPRESAFDLCGRIARVVRAAAAGGRFPIVLTGNCFSTVGAIAGLAPRVAGLLWLDAHADLNTPATSTSGFLDGMAAATCIGWCFDEHTTRLDGFTPVPESGLVLAGARDLDPAEEDALSRSRIRRLDVPALQSEGAVGDALRDFDAVYIHLDLDVLDPHGVGRANSFATAGGITAAELSAALKRAAAGRQVAGLTVSAYDPAEDPSGAVAAAAVSAVKDLAGAVAARAS